MKLLFHKKILLRTRTRTNNLGFNKTVFQIESLSSHDVMYSGSQKGTQPSREAAKQSDTKLRLLVSYFSSFNLQRWGKKSRTPLTEPLLRNSFCTLWQAALLYLFLYLASDPFLSWADSCHLMSLRGQQQIELLSADQLTSMQVPWWRDSTPHPSH